MAPMMTIITDPLVQLPHTSAMLDLMTVSVSQASPLQPSSPVSRRLPRPRTPPHGGENGKTRSSSW